MAGNEAAAIPGILAAGGGMDPLVRDIGLCLLFSGLLTVLFARFRIPSLAALLLAGVLLGPETPGFTADRRNVATIANLGLVFLLFLIGLEMDFRKILASGRTLLLTGILQFPLCVLFGWAAGSLAAAAGWGTLAGEFAPLYVGLTAAASSTLIVVKLLQERYQVDTVAGRLSVGILILQDVWAIVVLAVQPNFAKPEIGTVIGGFAGIAILCWIAFSLSRLLLPACLRWIARTPELMLTAAVGWCFGIGFLGANLGTLADTLGFHAPLGVSLEMGALIAGASLASHPYSHHVVSRVAVVHDFFITLFFVALGMGIPRPDGATVLLLALFLAGVAFAARYAVFLPLLYATGTDRRNAFVVATQLAQISEFCLVIAFLGQQLGHIDARFASAVIFAFVITALASPFLFGRADALHGRLGPLFDRFGMRCSSVGEAGGPPAERHAVMVLGFHRVASSLLHEIGRRHPALLREVLVLDINPSIHDAIRARGANACYADIALPEALRSAGVDRAKVAICTIPDDLLRGTDNLRVVKTLRSLAPDIVIVANSLTLRGARELYDAGADYVYLQRVEAAASLAPVVVAAVEGGIRDYRREQEALHGRPEERSEVLP